MFTANIMSSAVETLGMSLPGHHMLKKVVLNLIHCYIGKFYTLFLIACIGLASDPAVDTDNVVTVQKKEECAKVVDTVFQLLEKRITAKQILTKKVNTQENHLIMVLVYNKVSFQR